MQASGLWEVHLSILQSPKKLQTWGRPHLAGWCGLLREGEVPGVLPAQAVGVSWLYPRGRCGSDVLRTHSRLWCVTLIPAWPGSLLLAHLGPDSPSDYNWPWTLATSPWALERVDNVLISWSQGCTPHNHLKIRATELPGWRSVSSCLMPSILFPAYLQLLGLTCD